MRSTAGTPISRTSTRRYATTGALQHKLPTLMAAKTGRPIIRTARAICRIGIDGIASKYWNRLRQEVDRAFDRSDRPPGIVREKHFNLSRAPALHASSLPDYGAYGSNQNQEIRRQAPIADIVGVESDAALIGHVASTVDLPGAGHAGPGRKIELRMFAIVLKLFRYDRPRPDEAHIAADYIDQLRQLVSARIPQERSQWRDAGIAFQLPV